MRYLLVAVLLLSCGCQSVPADYVGADEATYVSAAERWDAWVDADASLDADRKAAKKAVLRAWRSRIDAAKSGLGK